MAKFRAKIQIWQNVCPKNGTSPYLKHEKRHLNCINFEASCADFQAKEFRRFGYSDQLAGEAERM